MLANQVPIVVLKEGTSGIKGNQAHKNNITAAKTVAEIMRTSKEQVINAATEAACMILRIDDVIAASRPKDMPKPGGHDRGMGDMAM